MTDHRPQIRQHLSRYFDVSAVDDEDDIFARNLLNSLYAMQLVLWVEKTFSLSLTDDELSLDTFRSISSIARFVEQRSSR